MKQGESWMAEERRPATPVIWRLVGRVNAGTHYEFEAHDADGVRWTKTQSVEVFWKGWGL